MVNGFSTRSCSDANNSTKWPLLQKKAMSLQHIALLPQCLAYSNINLEEIRHFDFLWIEKYQTPAQLPNPSGWFFSNSSMSADCSVLTILTQLCCSDNQSMK